MALDEAGGTLPPLAWEIPTFLFEDYTLLQAVPSDADEFAVLATAIARVGHFGVDLRDNLHLTSDQLRVVFWQNGAALFHCSYSFAQAGESICQEMEASGMLVLFHTHAFMFCWLTTEAASLPPETTFDHREPTTFPSTPFHVHEGRLLGQVTAGELGAFMSQSLQWGVGVVLAMAGWCLSTDLVRQWPGRDTVYLCPTMHGLQLGVEDMAHCVAAYHFSCLLDEIIALHCASVPGRAAGIRLAEASIQYLGFVMFSGSIPTCLPVDALYDAWRFVNGIIVLAGRVQMVVL
ncbi:unnamed protein product, partial [Effrenium voratum]